MASKIFAGLFLIVIILCVCSETGAKYNENKTSENHSGELKSKKGGDSAVLMFADEFRQTLERYLFGICPQSYKMIPKGKNYTASCDLDSDQQDLAGRLATLALRAHTASRADCSRFAAALANTLGELARAAANRQLMANAAASSAASEAKKRKLSKSQKAKIQAKQRTALAVKKKAAALAAAAAAKMQAS